MIFILLALVIFIIGEIFHSKLYRNGEKQFKKYDKEHSTVPSVSANDFALRLNAISNPEISKVECNGNKVNLVCRKNEYTINVENGVASVEYDKGGYEIKISKMGRFFNRFKLRKSARKATVINRVMDCVSGKNIEDSEKEYREVENNIKTLNILEILGVIFLIIGMCNMAGNLSGKAIDNVKTTEFSTGVTYEELISGYIQTPEWDAFNSDKDRVIVEVNGTSIENEKICMQFAGDPGMGFNHVNLQKFQLIYFEADGESLDPDAAMEYIYEYLK